MDQMDIYWEVASGAAAISAIVITAFLFARFLRPFLSKDRYAWEAGGAYILTMLIAYVISLELPGMIPEALSLMAAFGVICFRDKDDQISQHINSRCNIRVKNLEQKIFLVVVIYLIEWFSHGIAFPFRDVLFRVILFSPRVLEIHAMAYWGLYVGIEFISLSLRFTIMFMLFHIIDRVYVYKKENISKKELGLLLSIPLSVLAGYFSFTFFFEVYLGDIQQYIQENHVLYNWIKALYQIISFAAIFSAIVLYQKIKESYKQEKEKAVLEEQTESMKKHMTEVEALYQNIRGLKHDMGNHVMILENLCQNNQQEAISYLSNLKEELYAITSEIRTGNPITDVIIAEEEKEAARKGIDFSCNFHYPKGAGINAFDVGIILSNAVGNAIEGAAGCENPFIRISSYQGKNGYLIEIRNSYKGKLLVDGENKLPVSTKEDREEHGFGLANIQRVARKYFGDIEIKADEGVFTLHVMLLLK